MRARQRRERAHPLAPILLAALAAGVFGVLFHFFGICRSIYELALAALLFFGFSVAMTLVVAGIGYLVVRIHRKVGRS